MTRQSGHLNGQNTKIFEGQMKTGARGQRASVFPRNPLFMGVSRYFRCVIPLGFKPKTFRTGI